MFQHILVPTDGSPLSEAAAAKALAFAREIGARVTGLSVKPQFHPFTLRPEQVEDTRGDRGTSISTPVTTSRRWNARPGPLESPARGSW